MLRSVDPVEIGDAAGGDDHDIDILRPGLLGLQVPVELHLDPERLELPDAPVDEPDEVPAPVRLHREEHLPAERAGCLDEAHLVTALGAHPRRLQSARAAARDQDPALLRRRLDLVRQLALVPGGRVVEAGGAHLAHAVGGAYAGAHARLVAPRELRHQRGIRNVRPGHRDHVEQAFADRMARGGKLGDAGGVKHRQPHRRLEGAGPRKEGRHRRGHARHAVHRELEIGVHPAVDRVEEVDGSRRLEDPGDRETLVEVQVALARLVDDEADSDDEIIPDPLANRLVHHQPEAAALLDGAAETVPAVVRRGREELPDEMRSGKGLDAVELPLPATRRRLGVVGDDPRDVVLVHLPGEGAVPGLAHRGRADGGEARARVVLAPPAQVAHLAHDPGAMGVDALREAPEVRDDAIVVEVELGRVPLRVGRDVGRAPEHGERDPAPRLRLVVALVAFHRHPVLGETAGVAGAHDAVAKDEMLEPEGLEQGIRGAAHIATTLSGSILSLKVCPPAISASAGERFCRATTIPVPSSARQW